VHVRFDNFARSTINSLESSIAFYNYFFPEFLLTVANNEMTVLQIEARNIKQRYDKQDELTTSGTGNA